MNNDKIFLSADDVAEELNISKPFAYKLIRSLNSELKAKGFVTISGKLRCIVLRIDNIGIRYVKIISLIYFFVGINILYFNIKELKYENLSGLLIGGIVLFMGIYNYIYCNIINKYQ